MIVRALALAGGLTGAAGFSQLPEFSQQYIQRMGGAVDELDRVVADFDADAAGLDMDRESALVQLAKGGDIGVARARTMSATIKRHDRLSADLAALEGAGPFTRAYQMRRFSDGELTRNAWQAFRPALPLTFEGAVFAGAGFIAGLVLVALVLGVWRLIFPSQRRRPA